MKNRKGSNKDRTNIHVSVKLVGSHGAVSSYYTGTISRFLSRIKAKEWKFCHIKVSYGKDIDAFGKTVEFTNEGTYENKHDATQALKAFLE